MNEHYLIIFRRPEGFDYYFLEDEDQLLETITACEYNDYEIMFAGNINVLKEYVN
jgi:hypothetical protein